MTSPPNPPLKYDATIVDVNAHVNNPEVILLLLTEVVRRKAVDPHRANLPDQFSTVPVAVGIAMAYRLAINGHMDYNLFWRGTNTHRYHFFSGYDRLEAFKRLAKLYHKTFAAEIGGDAISDYRALMVSYYGPIPPTLENEGVVISDFF